MEPMKRIVVIPAYNPDGRLLRLVEELHALSAPLIVVVDDGSGMGSKNIFENLQSHYGCEVLHHSENMGKGAALKTAARHIARRYSRNPGYVTADADLQHRPEDIVRVAEVLEGNPGSFVLGVRNLRGKDVPFKSKWGNRITSAVFRLKTGICCPDTQTGLRGVPARYAVDFERVSGERFEYEMNVLLTAAKKGISILQLPIQTVYLEQNRTSGFRAVRDSARIYFGILKFGASSLFCAGLDLTLFTLLVRIIPIHEIIAATCAARLISGCCNFLINKGLVFRIGGKPGGRAIKYAALFLGQMTASWLLVSALATLPMHIAVLKALADTGLFFVGYLIQKKYIFAGHADATINHTTRAGAIRAKGGPTSQRKPS
jgi:glycosyltransferase involved in cell wall biosynthesis